MAVLYVTATPIGNLNDFSPRGIETLKTAGYILLVGGPAVLVFFDQILE